MRTHYGNGDEIGLQYCGCDDCRPLMVNGVLCHEAGCMYAWKDETRECQVCGGEFDPESRFQSVCNDCIDDEIEN